MTNWNNAKIIAAGLSDAFNGLNMVTTTDGDLLELIKKLPVYQTLPALPESARERATIFYNIKLAYINAQSKKS